MRCGLIHPGFTDTPMVRALGDDYINKHILPFTHLGRVIRPEEIADAICFMLANSAAEGSGRTPARMSRRSASWRQPPPPAGCLGG